MDFPVTLDKTSNVPMWQQLFVGLRDAIFAGRLPHGHTLPSTRQLSELLHVSRDTILRCYEELICLGYVQSKVGMGTIVAWKPAVSPTIPSSPANDLDFAIDESMESRLSAYAIRLMNSRFGHANLELLNHGVAPFDLLPLAQWRKALTHCTLGPGGSGLEFLCEPFGYRPLRKAIATYLQRFKGVECNPDQILVATDATELQDAIARLLLNPGDAVVIETPGCSRLRALLSSYGARLHPTRVDQDGLVTDDLKTGTSKFAYVTPSHHDPTGFPMSLERRKQLLSWAMANSAFVVEDALDSDYRYGSQPLPSLHRLDNSNRVLYVYSFGKTLFPLTGISCLVVPPSLIDAFQRIASLSRHSVPITEAVAVTEMINGGHLERHIRRTWTQYTKRRQALIYALAQNFRSSVTYFKESAGYNLLVRFCTPATEEQILVSAAEAGLPLISTQDWYMDNAENREFLIPFALLASEKVPETVRDFAEGVRASELHLRSMASTLEAPGRGDAISGVMPVSKVSLT